MGKVGVQNSYSHVASQELQLQQNQLMISGPHCVRTAVGLFQGDVAFTLTAKLRLICFSYSTHSVQ